MVAIHLGAREEALVDSAGLGADGRRACYAGELAGRMAPGHPIDFAADIPIAVVVDPTVVGLHVAGTGDAVEDGSASLDTVAALDTPAATSCCRR